MEKICFKCGESKNISEFYKHKEMADGYLNKCKSCTKKDTKRNYVLKIDQYKKYDQIRNAARREYIAIRNSLYSSKNVRAINAAKKEWIKKNITKRNAHIILSNALRAGEVKRGICQICKSNITEAHHFSYDRPKNVIWLCKRHHEKIHWWLRWNKREYKGNI